MKRANQITGLNLYIKQNLTLRRRLIKERAEKELPSYQYKWVKNGNIFIRKDSYSKPIKIDDERVLNEIIKQETANSDITRTLRPQAPRGSDQGALVQLRSDSFTHALQPTPSSIPPFPFKRTYHPSAINSLYNFNSQALTNLNRNSVSL